MTTTGLFEKIAFTIYAALGLFQIAEIFWLFTLEVLPPLWIAVAPLGIMLVMFIVRMLVHVWSRQKEPS